MLVRAVRWLVTPILLGALAAASWYGYQELRPEPLPPGLERWQHHRATDLSGAIRQRLALACSVMHRPAVLFLDEPTSGVAPSARRRFWQLIYRLAAEGIAVLVTTHYLEEATYCHRLGLMHAGRLVVVGTQEELRAGLGRTSATTEEIFLGYIQRQRAELSAPQAERPGV